MASRACLVLLALVVERRQARRGGVLCQGVTFQTKQVRLRALQQARIGGSVGLMAGGAAFGLDRQVFKGEGASFVGMATETNLVLRCRRPQLLGQEPTVLVVAVGASNQALFHAMPEGAVEVLFDVGMAAVTQFRLLIDQQELLLLGVMGRVAGGAAYVIGIVLGTVEVGVFLSIFMAAQATLADVFRGFAGEDEDLTFVSAALDVFLARAVTSFATLPLRTLLAECRFPVRGGLEAFVNFFVAGLAGLGANVQRGIGGPDILGRGMHFAGLAIHAAGR